MVAVHARDSSPTRGAPAGDIEFVEKGRLKVPLWTTYTGAGCGEKEGATCFIAMMVAIQHEGLLAVAAGCGLPEPPRGGGEPRDHSFSPKMRWTGRGKGDYGARENTTAKHIEIHTCKVPPREGRACVRPQPNNAQTVRGRAGQTDTESTHLRRVGQQRGHVGVEVPQAVPASQEEGLLSTRTRGGGKGVGTIVYHPAVTKKRSRGRTRTPCLQQLACWPSQCTASSPFLGSLETVFAIVRAVSLERHLLVQCHPYSIPVEETTTLMACPHMVSFVAQMDARSNVSRGRRV